MTNDEISAGPNEVQRLREQIRKCEEVLKLVEVQRKKLDAACEQTLHKRAVLLEKVASLEAVEDLTFQAINGRAADYRQERIELALSQTVSALEQLTTRLEKLEGRGLPVVNPVGPLQGPPEQAVEKQTQQQLEAGLVERARERAAMSSQHGGGGIAIAAGRMPTKADL